MGMTKLFEQTKETPQTGFNIGDLSVGERARVRRIRIQGANSWGKKSAFNSVIYIEGDEERAAEIFVKSNREELEKLNLSDRNILQEQVDREVYDWILHHLGKRTLTKYETVVEESRPDETVWIIDRKLYETHHNRRYSMNERGVVKLTDCSPRDVFESFGSITSISGISNHDNVRTSTPETLLEYYRVAPDYNVELIEIRRKTDSGRVTESAVRKITESKS